MPFDFSRGAPLGFGLAILVAAMASPPAIAQQQQPDSPATQSQPAQNSIDRWNRMSPEERERELAKLPPARARAIRQRIWRYNHMQPEEREALRQRYESFSQLPPDQQQAVRERLREFRQSPPARRQAMQREVQQLRHLPEDQRLERMNSDEFRSRFSVQEQQIVRDVLTYLPK